MVVILMGIFIPLLMLIASYLIGAIPFGLLLGKLKGVDIRKYGSHNIGATNALRTLGTLSGFLVFVLDFVKGGLFVFLTKYVIIWNNDFFILQIHPLFYGLSAFIGHLFPIYLKFKGGKGISCFSGIIFAYAWPMGLCGLVGFALTVIITRYVSLASTIAGICLFLSFPIFCPNDYYLLGYLVIGYTLVIIKHLPNYKRLLSGKENKINLFKNKNKQEPK